MGVTFTTTIMQAEGKNATGIAVPPDVMTALGGGKKPAVKVTIGNYTYHNTVAVMGGTFMISVSAENRQGAGVKAGQEVEVTLELDVEPRTVEVPADLMAALTEQAGARMAFEALAFSRRKEFVRQVEESKNH